MCVCVFSSGLEMPSALVVIIILERRTATGRSVGGSGVFDMCHFHWTAGAGAAAAVDGVVGSIVFSIHKHFVTYPSRTWLVL